MLTNSDVAELTAFRHELHRYPEVSRQEDETAARVVAALGQLADRVVTGLGGHGVAAVFDSGKPGPSILFRSEIDALPIHEISTAPHRSLIHGVAHLCGHDGHSAILLGLARLLSRKRPSCGRVILMFQPAEEDGSGAAAVIADPHFADLHPDWAFSLHNMPGIKLGDCWLAPGPNCCASVGLKIEMEGKTSHAAQPDHGLSPGLAIAELIPALMALGSSRELSPDFRLVTITHALLGEPAFGIAPGHGEVWATLRTMIDARMESLKAQAVALAQTAAEKHGLRLTLSLHDDFAACANDPAATAQIAAALEALNIQHTPGALPMRASEDFGRFGHLPGCKSAMLMLGAGLNHPSLHNPDYDFPDDLIATGTQIFHRIARDMLG
ncbi:amidohydrolase [Pseudorhodobacter sp.]|uniref:amidohydrolase n=1 Tax=Pseudorhodobacter sp. TaxID=1934400 RepID=UPI0026471EE3|nr:amidohydrolase [Pseudorhodobacter sp.]MDN5788185.1 amidohydrolase [Pseudorhodobacter sp.]